MDEIEETQEGAEEAAPMMPEGDTEAAPEETGEEEAA